MPTNTMPAIDWSARLRVAAEKSSRRRRARAAAREVLARRRAHGQIDRQAARLAEACARPQP